MKKSTLFIAVASLFVFSSCEELLTTCGVENPDFTIAEEGLNATGVMINTYNRIDQALRDTTLMQTGNAVIDNVPVSLVGNQLEFDFGNGTSGKDGKTREGKIKALITGDYFTQGGGVGVSFENFIVEDAVVGGTYSISNISAGAPKFQLAATEVEYNDIVELDAAFNLTWLSGFATNNDLQDDAYSFSGTSTIELLDLSETMDLTIQSPMIYERSCPYGIVDGYIDASWTGDSVPFDVLTIDFVQSDNCNDIFQIGIECEETTATVTKNFSGF